MEVHVALLWKPLEVFTGMDILASEDDADGLGCRSGVCARDGLMFWAIRENDGAQWQAKQPEEEAVGASMCIKRQPWKTRCRGRSSGRWSRASVFIGIAFESMDVQ